MSAVSIIGWDPVVPGIGIQVLFQQGLSSGNTGLYDLLLTGNLLSTGAWASLPGGSVDGYIAGPGTKATINCQNEQDVITGAGAGSELHRMFRKAVKANPNANIYLAPVLESTGSKASLAITIAGTPTANGTVRFRIGQDTVDVGYATTQATYYNGTAWVSQSGGDTATTIAENAAALINANVNLPVTATSSTGTVTITAKQKGLRGNWLRGSAVILNGTGVTSNTTKQTFFTGGTTADSNANVLNFLATNPARFYIQISAAEDATQFTAHAAQMSSLAPAIPGNRQRCFAGSVDTLGNVCSIATGINNQRAEIVWLTNSDLTPAEMASEVAALYNAFEVPPLTAQYSVNFNNLGIDASSVGLITARQPLDGSNPSRNQVKAAILSGVTPMGVGVGGQCYVVKRVTTRTLNGSANDYRAADGSRITICDVFADELGNQLAASYPRCVIADNPPKNAARQPPPGVVYPNLVRPSVVKKVTDYNNNGVLNDYQLIVDGIIVERDPTNRARLSIKVPIRTAVPLHQIGLSVEENSSF